MPKLVIEIDTENGYTQFFKRRDVLVKVMGEVERILRKKDPDTSKVAVKGGGISAFWRAEQPEAPPAPPEEVVQLVVEPPVKKRA